MINVGDSGNNLTKTEIILCIIGAVISVGLTVFLFSNPYFRNYKKTQMKNEHAQLM